MCCPIVENLSPSRDGGKTGRSLSSKARVAVAGDFTVRPCVATV